MNIQDLHYKIKSKLGRNPPGDTGPKIVEFDAEGKVVRRDLFRKLFLVLCIILFGTLSFGLGRLSGGAEREGVRIEYDPGAISNQSSERLAPLEAVSPGATVGSNGVVGSKNSDKYHYPHCPGAKQISDKNKIAFASVAAAEAAGYTLAGNCNK